MPLILKKREETPRVAIVPNPVNRTQSALNDIGSSLKKNKLLYNIIYMKIVLIININSC